MARRTTSKTGTTKRTTTPRKPRSTASTQKTAEVVDAEVVSSTEAAAATDTSAEARDTPTATDTPAAAGETPEEPGIDKGAEALEAEPTANESDVDAGGEGLKEPETASPTESGGEATEVSDNPSAREETKDVVDTGAAPASEEPGKPSAPTMDASPAVQPTATPAPQKSGGFLPMLLGGAVAAGLGYSAHYLQTSQPPAPDAELVALQAEMAQLRATVAQGPDLSALEARIAALGQTSAPDTSAIDAALDELRGEIAALPDVSVLQSQLDELRSEPDLDLGPLEQGLATLQSAVAPLPGQIAALQAEMADLRALATTEIEQAEAAVDKALAQSGLDRIAAALVTGVPFSDAVAQLREAGVALPDTVAANAAQGVQTLEALQEGFGDAARAAISASLQTAPADSATEKLGNFFRAQIGARSLAPREGDDPDAVTSRAGAAVEAGDLAAALAELSALPEDGRAAMAQWLSATQTRLDVAAAIDALQADLTTR